MGRKGTKFEIPANYHDLVTLKQAEALSMQLQGLTYWEIAEELSITPESVNCRLISARRRIKGERDPKRTGPLSPREQETFDLRQQGFNPKQIAKKMHITIYTVKNYITVINYKKSYEEG